jgi:hypothetical protein
MELFGVKNLVNLCEETTDILIYSKLFITN